MSPIIITPAMLNKLLTLYFRDLLVDGQNVEKFAQELNDSDITILDVVEACTVVLPELEGPESLYKKRFDKLLNTKMHNQVEALRAVLRIYEDLKNNHRCG